MEIESEEYEKIVGPDKERKVLRIRVDEIANNAGTRISIHIATTNGTQLQNSIVMTFLASNNEAKYEAILAEMRMEIALQIKILRVFNNSKLVMD